jgi:hypothetical protein
MMPKALVYLHPGKFPLPSASIVDKLFAIIGIIGTIIVAQSSSGVRG